MRKKKAVISLWLTLLSLFYCLGQVHSLRVFPGSRLPLPENQAARKILKDVIFSGINPARANDKAILDQSATEPKVMFRLKEETDSYFLLFIGGQGNDFSLLKRGNFSIKKQKQNGEFAYLTILLRDENNTYLRVFPAGDRAGMELYLCGSLLYRNIILPLSFEKLVLSSFATIVSLTENLVDWDLILYQRSSPGDDRLATITGQIRKALPLLQDSEDGAYNQWGQPVFIDTEKLQGAAGGLNCSGFAKWLIDGFYFTATSGLMKIEALKLRSLQERGNRWNTRYEQQRDPYFGLDWTRNLAAMLYNAEFGGAASSSEAFDVRELPFVGYVEDVGYPVAELKLLMYLLAVAKPGSFYLGSVNGQFGKNPVLWQHFHIVILFPHFTTDNRLQITVFERNRESGADSLIKQQQGHYIHLVEIKTSLPFSADYMGSFSE